MFGAYKKTFQLVKRWFMIPPNYLILMGLLLIAGGTYIVSHGWNKKSAVSQKNNIIRAVVQEWKMNIFIITHQKFEETEEKKLAEYTLFPRLQTAIIAGALSSGHFTDKSDPNFLDAGI